MTARGLARQGSRYLLTGGAAALVDIGLFWFATAWGLAVVPAALASFFAATIVNYRLTSHYVFAVAAGWRGYSRFLAAATLGMIINVSLTGLLVAYTPAPPVFAKICGVGTAFLINFLLNALIVFKQSEEKDLS